LLTHPQQARRYATESGASKGGSNTLLLVAGAGALGGAGYYFLSGSSAPAAAAAKVAEATTSTKAPAFTGGDQGFVSLRLAEVENINHNTKRFRFELPESDQVSGLTVASAILTKYKGPNDEKATLRPYTPINDEGMYNTLLLLTAGATETKGRLLTFSCN
jgi:cytochrome-b5 reductase